MNYIEELKKLVCSQVDEFIIDVMRPEKDADYQTRRDELASVTPTYGTQDDGSTMLVKQYDSNGKLVSDINNNPKFTMNMIEMMNTPFDHIDRILLQDFSSAHVNDDDKLDIDKYIYGLFNNSENDKRIKLNSRRENIEGSPDGDASRAHRRVCTWASANGAVVTGRRSSAHCSVRQCPLENPPVGTGESAGAHGTQDAQGDLQSPLGE